MRPELEARAAVDGDRFSGEDEASGPLPGDRHQRLVLVRLTLDLEQDVEGNHPRSASDEEVGQLGQVAAGEGLALAQVPEGVLVNVHEDDPGRRMPVPHELEGVDGAGLPAREDADARQPDHREADGGAEEEGWNDPALARRSNRSHQNVIGVWRRSKGRAIL